MPYLQPQSLSNDEVHALTAYVLNRTGIIGEGDEMNAQTLPKAKMPSQASCIAVYPPRGK
jgi:cytochrome c